jgi:acyl carrier protein
MPDYMLPSAFVILEQLPLTPNGKIDRAALPAPDGGDTLPIEGAAGPASEVEKRVADIVASLLRVDRVDPQANFFDLGGHSLLGAQLIARVRAAFGINLPLRKVFEAATVSELSAEIEEILVAEVEAMGEDEIRHLAGLTRQPTAEEVLH